MKREISERIEHYKKLWTGMADYGSVISSSPEGREFLVRHHSFFRSDIKEKSRYHEYTDEMYDSLYDFLACYRWYVIPGRLREVSGLSDETDLEILLDSSGYSASLIAEELFCMIDDCLESGHCSEKELHRIRLAYNGLSGFQDDVVCRIAQCGNAVFEGYPVMSHIQNPFLEGYYAGCISKPPISISAAPLSGAFAG